MQRTQDSFYRLVLILLVVLAFGLRLYRLDAQSLWYDEGVTATVAQYDLASLTRWTADDIQPPLYYYVVAGWGRLAGWSEWSLRFPSAFFGTLTASLLAALAVRLTHSRLVGVLAALFTALHPLLVYYSQEARMYTMLVALGVLAGYCVLRSGHCVERKGIHWLGYVLVATAAVYTHYFAFFLLLALSIAHVLDWPRLARLARRADGGGRRDDGRWTFAPSPFFLANLAVLVLYLPWLRVLFTQLNVDASYWQGSLKLWEALRSVAIRFTSGETVLEAPATRLLWMYGAVTLLAIGGIAHYVLRMTHHAPRTTHYATLWLLVPVIAVLTLASFTPKFNARYVMVALPGLILLWSRGLAELLRAGTPLWPRLPRMACPTEPRPLPALLGLIGTGLLVSGFLVADVNWYTDLAFTKDQWRELAQHIRAYREPDEAVALVSGHAWPVWRYYAPDIDAVRLPQLEILNVDAVLDLANTATPLRTALAGKTGVWLVDWQDEVVDPMDVTGLQLTRAGAEQPVDAEFWGLRLRHFTGLHPDAITPEPPIQHRVDDNFGNAITLLGYTVADNGDLLLFWKLQTEAVGQPATRNPQYLVPDYHLTAETFTAGGLLFADPADRRLAAYNYPTFRWQPGQVTVGRIPAEEWVGGGAPAGNYRLRLGVYDPVGDPAGLDLLGDNGTRLGKRPTIDVRLDRPLPIGVGENPTTWHEIADGLFVKPTLPANEAEAGQPLTLKMLWYATEPLTVRMLTINWNEQSRAVQWGGQRQEMELNLPQEQIVRTVHRVRPPLDLPPGDYWLELTVDRIPTRPLLLPLRVRPSTRTFTLPEMDSPIGAVFGDRLALAGVQGALASSVARGATLRLRLVWQSLASVNRDYAVTVQWLDADSRPVLQRDALLPEGSSTWLPEEVVSQRMDLAAPEQPGPYRLIVAVYDPDRPGLPRLALPSGDDFVELTSIEVTP